MTIEELYKTGLKLLKEQKNDLALEAFEEVLSLAPQHFNTKFYIATILLLEEKLGLAEEKFLDLLAHKPEDPEILTNLGVIALRQELNQKAVDYFVKALCFDNNHIEARHNLAATFIHHDRFQNALPHYQILLENDKENPEYLYNLGVIYMQLNKLEDAIYFFNKVTKNASQHRAALQNLSVIYIQQQNEALVLKTLDTLKNLYAEDEYSDFLKQAYTKNNNDHKALPEYVKNLFNRYALYYEKHLVETLEYRLPQHIKQLTNKYIKLRLNKGLDLGCGTGLCANILNELCTYTVGVDLAADMLAHAKKEARYSEYHEANILDFLANTEENYDLIILADVIPYLGELETLFKALKKALSPKGYIVLSHEINTKDNWRLEKTTRFSHNPAYIKANCIQNSFEILSEEKVVGRLQNKLPLEVNLYLIRS